MEGLNVKVFTDEKLIFENLDEFLASCAPEGEHWEWKLTGFFGDEYVIFYGEPA